MEKIVLVTGANRGIGLEVGKQLVNVAVHVIFTARNLNDPNLVKLQEEFSAERISFHELDVAREESIKK